MGGHRPDALLCEECCGSGRGVGDDGAEVLVQAGAWLTAWAVRHVLAVLPGAYWRAADSNVFFGAGIYVGMALKVRS